MNEHGRVDVTRRRVPSTTLMVGIDGYERMASRTIQMARGWIAPKMEYDRVELELPLTSAMI